MADASAITPAECGQLQLPQTVVSHDAIEETVCNGGTRREVVVVEAHLLKSKSTIHRFPSNLRRIGREKDYIAPRTVAIGPYYHGEPELQPMEGVKRALVEHFLHGKNESARKEIYERIKPIACEARGCYADADALTGITDDKFAEMMFVDGCFLVQFLYTLLREDSKTSMRSIIHPCLRENSSKTSIRSIIHPHVIGIMRDMMLLENQIPWPVTEFLMALKSSPLKSSRLKRSPLKSFTKEYISGFLAVHIHGRMSEELVGREIDHAYKPSHLLCLIRSFEAGKCSTKGGNPCRDTFQVSTSAAELAEIGIKLEARGTQFSSMNVVKNPFYARLSLPPLYLDNLSACFLVNMAAFEMCIESYWKNDCSINSYLAVLSLLMTKEEDVRELRAKRIVHGSSDQQTLEFFKGLQASNVCQGKVYMGIIVGLANYKYDRRVWIAIYRFVYKNAKTIATVLSVIGVLVGIFKTLLSLKQNQH